MEYILLILIFVGGVGWGWRLREKMAVQNMQKILDNVEESAEELEEDLNRIPVTIERLNSQLFVYSMEDSSFMAQGDDWKEVEERLSSRYPGKKFHATRENLIEMGFKL
jgi:restriction endonuclease S subunit